MQWQKLSNVNVPMNQLLLIWDPHGNSILFAKRTLADRVDFAESYLNNRLSGNVDHLRYTEFIKMNSHTYWCLFKQPF